jgi:ATP-dependent HslUV protease subunit HslV
MALKRNNPAMSAKEIAVNALNIAADICIYTNHNIEVLELPEL